MDLIPIIVVDHSEVHSSPTHKDYECKEDESYIDVSMASFCGQAEDRISL